jgi:hypothetical protein
LRFKISSKPFNGMAANCGKLRENASYYYKAKRVIQLKTYQRFLNAGRLILNSKSSTYYYAANAFFLADLVIKPGVDIWPTCATCIPTITGLIEELEIVTELEELFHCACIDKLD